LADFLGFLFSLLIALRGYSLVANLLRANFSLPHSVSNAIGFLLVAGLSEAILAFFFAGLLKKIPSKFWKKPWSRLAAIFPALGQGIILVSFILILVVSLPLIPKVKTDVTESKIGGYLVGKTAGVEVRINEIFGGLIEDSLTYLTVQPGSSESIPITSEPRGLVVDEVSEQELFRLVNEERVSKGIPALVWRTEIVPVARAHARDMWERQYFGHYSPEGEDVGDRLQKGGVSYFLAGENLALAPTVQTAHNGLMNSQGHRENILDTEFRSIGIGVIDNGVYGKMFVQVFTD